MTASTQLHIDTSYPSPDMARVALAGEVYPATAPVLRDRLLSLSQGQALAVLDIELDGCRLTEALTLTNAKNGIHRHPPMEVTEQ